MMLRVPARPGLATVAALGLGGLLYWQLQKARDGEASVTESIDVAVPLSTAYNQWTQFEEFPRFMQSVEEVKQIDDRHQHWRAKVAGKTKEWDAELTEQIPDQRIAWRSTTGPKSSGMVSFEKIGVNRTRVKLQMDYQPETAAERAGGALGGMRLAARSNLKGFKKLIEVRGAETGAWRGTIAPQ